MVVDEVTLSKCPWDCARSRTPATFTDCFTRIEDNVHTVANNSLLPKSTLILLAATLLLVLLFLMATILVYRVSFLYSKNSSDDGWSKPGHRLSRYLELLKQQQEAVEEEILRITTTLKNRLNDLGQVRQSIDQISAFTKQSSFHMRNDNIEKPTMNAHAPS